MHPGGAAAPAAAAARVATIAPAVSTRAVRCPQVLIHTGVANYMEFKPVDGSFVYSAKVANIT